MNVHERLIAERERIGLNQDQMALAGGIKKRAYCYYESGERVPDAEFLAGIAKFGADVRYIVTGDREGPAPEVLTSDERELLAMFRSLSLTGKAAAIGALQGVAGATGKNFTQNNTGNFGQITQTGKVTVRTPDSSKK